MRTVADEHLSQTKKGDDDLIEFYDQLFASLQQHAREYQDTFAEQVKINQATKEQYTERLGLMDEEISKNPGTSQATIKRAAGVRKEVDRLASLIATLQAEVDWFDDALRSFGEARDRTAANAARTFADAEAARLRLAQVMTGQAQAQDRQPLTALGTVVPSGILKAFGGRYGGLLLGTNVVSILVFIVMTIATGREYSAFMLANQPVRRALVAAAHDNWMLVLKAPQFEFFWEFIFVLFAAIAGYFSRSMGTMTSFVRRLGPRT
ncbi:hypothetical protein F5B19DRAFT_452848 [Rostrohypoxylon terebratum]|nr:hypothetical protein F5B19DRAFT_452848 [Rostrohypoxylon terebratum]